MSRKRRILKMAGVKRSTKRLVVTVTVTEYPNDAEGKPVAPDVHLNLDNANGLGELDVRAIFQRLLTEVEEKIKVREEAASHGGARMLAGAGVALMQPREMFPTSNPLACKEGTMDQAMKEQVIAQLTSGRPDRTGDIVMPNQVPTPGEVGNEMARQKEMAFLEGAGLLSKE